MDYHYFCRQLYDIIKENTFEYNIKLYEERRINYYDRDNILDGNTLIFKHFWIKKNYTRRERFIIFKQILVVKYIRWYLMKTIVNLLTRQDNDEILKGKLLTV